MGPGNQRPVGEQSAWSRVLRLALTPLVFLGRALSGAGVTLLLLLIRFYQRFISPGLHPCCRFVPSCSEYAAESLKKHGVFRGVGRSVWRVARCNPLCKGGIDEP